MCIRDRFESCQGGEGHIFPEPTVLARVQAGELDASSAYKVQPGPFNLPYMTLPDAVNLGSPAMSAAYGQVSLQLGDRVYRPEPLIYYAAVLEDASNPRGAASFVRWLAGPDGMRLLRTYHYDAPLAARAL